jgi:biofilm PGA synthesis N-glycosyltransferase PgaC
MADFLFAFSSVALAYTYLGYPALIWVLARLFPRSVSRGADQPRVVVVIVVHNEASRILRKLESCCALNYPSDKFRILVVSDGSDDATNETVAAFPDPRVSLLAFSRRRGKAACLNDAVASCGEDIIVLTDARQRLDAGALSCLVENFADSRVGAVSGDLIFDADGLTQFGDGVDTYWRYEKFIRKQESRLHSTVGVTGALYALRREAFRAIPENTILDDVLIPMNAAMSGLRVVFETGAKAYDRPSSDAQQEKRRKVRTLAGNVQLLASNGRFLVPGRNPLFFQLVSHKVLRLLAPFFMLTLAVTNIQLARKDALYTLALIGQMLAYGAAGAGIAVPSSGRWKAVRVASAFLLLNWFAVLGILEFLSNPRPQLWPSGGSARD